MYPLRFLALSFFVAVPLFVFAQTTTTAEQPVREDELLRQQIDQLTTSRLNLLPKLTDIRAIAIRDLLDVKVNPSNPGPNETVRVTIESYISDMNKAAITWSLNGSVAMQGVGKTSFSFQNGASGKTTSLVVSILTNDGESITKEFSWTPVGVTLLWEADTYTPPFYRGKALLSPQAWVKMIAIPDNTGAQNALSAGNLVYVWEKSGVAIQDASGYGKNSFSFVGPKPYDETNIKVRTSSVDNTVNSESRAYLSLSNPFILFYEKDPLLGVWYNKPLDTEAALNKKELSLSAEPYFFSNEARVGKVASALKYIWSINGNEIPNYGRTITLRNDTGAKGKSVVSLAMRGATKTFQSASRNIQVNFSGNDSSSRPTF